MESTLKGNNLPLYHHSVYSIFEKNSRIRKKKDVYKRTCLFAGKLFPLFFLLFTYVLWQKGGCSFSVKSYTYLHAIVLVFYIRV